MTRHYFVLHQVQEANICIVHNWMTICKHQQKTDAQSRKRKQMYDEIEAVMDKKTCIEKEVEELQNGIEDFASRLKS